MTRRKRSIRDNDRPIDSISDQIVPTGRATRDTPEPRPKAAPLRASRTRTPAVQRPLKPTGGAPTTGPEIETPDTFTHHYVVRLATTQLNHDREIAAIVRAMGRKKWAVESRESIPGASAGETVTVLMFVQTTLTERSPNAPVNASIVKSGASVSRRHR